MAGRTVNGAYRHYINPLRSAIHCVTRQRLTLRDTAKRLQLNTVYAVALNDMSPVILAGDIPIALTVGQQFRIIDAEGDRGPYKATIVKYFYSLSIPEAGDAEGPEIITFQWTPEDEHAVTFPHLHIGRAVVSDGTLVRPGTIHKAHIPTGRVSLEAVIRLAIEEFQVKPLKPDYDAILADSETAFDEWKTR